MGQFTKMDLFLPATPKQFFKMQLIKCIRFRSLTPLWFLFILVSGSFGFASEEATNNDTQSFKIGLIADCQFCQAPTTGVRHYNLSLRKLKDCVEHFNHEDLDFVIHLGDFIDREWSNFDMLLPIWKTLNAPSYHVLGNHDFSVADEFKDQVSDKLNMPSRFYSFEKKGWRFIVLDGNDLSLHAYPREDPRYRLSEEYYRTHAKTKPNWNGAVGSEQMQWLETELIECQTQEKKVMVFCHFPVFPENVHNLWNADKVLEIIKRFQCVKAYVNGHNHAGHYDKSEGIHFLTMKGMVDTTETSYGILNISHDVLELKGSGRQKDIHMPIR